MIKGINIFNRNFKKSLVSVLGLLIFLFIIPVSRAQNIFSDLRSLEKRGDYYYSRLAYAKAADLYALALKKKKNKADYTLNVKAAKLYKTLSRYEDAKNSFENIINSGPRLSKTDSINYFNILKAVGDVKADTFFTAHYSRKILNNLFRDTLFYNLYEVPINTEKSEYCPIPLDNGLLFVSEEDNNSLVRKLNALNNGGFARMYYAARTDTGWLSPVPISSNFKNLLHIGPATIYNGNKVMVNVVLEGENNKHLLSLGSAEYNDGGLYNFSPLSLNNASYSIGHPSVSQDGKILYFVSDKEGGKGGTDIYISTFKNGRWSDPANLGNKINTPGDEKYPYLSKDNVLFFSSDGRYGLGGMDIYYIDLQFKDSIAVNMGYPVNSTMDDFGFSLDASKKIGYFSSNRKSNGKDDDLYQYTENKIYLDVNVFDDFNKEKLKDFTVELWDNEMNIPIRNFRGKSLSIVNAWLRPAHNYSVIIKKEDYKSDTLKLSTYDIIDYTKTIFQIIYVKRKPVYFASLKLKNEPSKENFSDALIIVNNLTERFMDTLDHKGPSAIIKLDGNCEYIITSRDGDKLRYIYVEKKAITITDKLPYYNLYLTAARPSVLHMQIKNCKGQVPLLPNFRIKVMDWVNGNDFFIAPGPDGDFQLVVTDSRLFAVYLNNKPINYSINEIRLDGYCINYLEK